MKNQIINLIQRFLALLQQELDKQKRMKASLKKVYDTSYRNLYPARDVSPKDRAPDELACVESLWEILKQVDGSYPGGKLVLGTQAAFNILSESPLYTMVENPEPGSIIISVTEVRNGKTVHGHCGIYGYTHIMNNDSRTGLWLASYTFEMWDAYFEKKLALRTYYFNHI